MEEKYISKISALYDLKDDAVAKLKAGRDQIKMALKDYNWSDVEHAIDRFYVWKSDKQRPKLCQICAILNDWEHDGKIQKLEIVPDTPPVQWRPTTKIFTIAATFDRMVQIMIECGIILGPDSPEPTSSLVDDKGEVILGVRQWLRWQVQDAINLRPDLFAPFPYATFWEQLAIGLQNKIITIRVRNWRKYWESLKMKNNT